MRETQWIEWTRTRLQPQERQELLTALTSQQKAMERTDDFAGGGGLDNAVPSLGAG